MKRPSLLSFIIIYGSGLFFSPLFANEVGGSDLLQQTTKNSVGKSGYPLPRFGSLSRQTTNIRKGPDLKYPILWIYKKKNYPLKVIAEYDDWRQVIDQDNQVGWVWSKLIRGTRTGLITQRRQTIYTKPSTQSEIAFFAAEGVIVKILTCEKSWCEIQTGDHKGWLPQKDFWGTLKRENIN